MRTMSFIGLIFTLSFGACTATTERQVDFSELLATVKGEAPAHLSVDGFGKPYEAAKPWHVSTFFIEHPQFYSLLSHRYHALPDSGDVSTLGLRRDFTFRANLEAGLSGVAFPADSAFRVSEAPYYLLRMQNPMRSERAGEFVSCLWLKDHSWTSGFHIFVRFTVNSGQAVLVAADYLAVSDVQEFEAGRQLQPTGGCPTLTYLFRQSLSVVWHSEKCSLYAAGLPASWFASFVRR